IDFLYLQSDDIGQQAHHHKPSDGNDPDLQGDILHELCRQRDGVAPQCLHGRQNVTADQGRRLDDSRARFLGLCRCFRDDRLSEHGGVMLPGVTIAMGGRGWQVPPLTLGQLRRLMPKVRQLTEIGALMGETQITVLVEIVAAAMQRNYPEATVEMVENLLDLGNASAVLNAVLTGSGLKLSDSRLGEAAAPGSSPGAEPT